MHSILLIIEEREDERWLLQRALLHEGILQHAAFVRSAAEALDYISRKREFADRERFPLPRTIVLPASLQSLPPTTLIRKIAPLSFVWNGRIVLLSASEEHPEAVEAAKLGASVFLRPFAPSK